MQIPLVQLARQGENFVIAGTRTVAHPKLYDMVYTGRTVGDVEQAAHEYPMTPSPNAYLPLEKTPKARERTFQLASLGDEEYKKAMEIMETQRKLQPLD